MQLGPARKRLSDRLKEARALVEDADVDTEELKTIRTKLKANILYFEQLTDKLHNKAIKTKLHFRLSYKLPFVITTKK